MIISKKILKLGILVLLYFFLFVPTALIILFTGHGDESFVIVYGLFCALFLMLIKNLDKVISIFLGILNSSLSLIIVYVLNYFVPFSYKKAGLIFVVIIILTTTITYRINFLNLNFLKKAIIFLTSLGFLIIAFNMKPWHNAIEENKNLKPVEILVLNNNKTLAIGDSLDVLIVRHPFFGMQESHKVFKTTTNQNGIANVNLSPNHQYRVFVTREEKFDIFDIDSLKIKSKNKIVLCKMK